MDAKARNAVLRAKLKEAAQKREKPLDDPLVRYNDLDQPVCKICNVAVKSESLWLAHKTSRKHLEVIAKLKANAAEISRVSSAKLNVNNDVGMDTSKSNLVANLQPISQSSSSLPADFFDKQDTERQKSGELSRIFDVAPLILDEFCFHCEDCSNF
ncbi:hypothetical protein AMTR_s00107p00046790 [Amborella trichopoda]|uniref:C2H2-type domain-containing protein n=1 Tax=Amborella trichopoda TaxID=13333 RepID=W1NYC4_AMBTC|nr:hypothetical protein AMTR_s00107p00046790 [Amborella trichopoda]